MFLTVAGANGATLHADDPIVGSLTGAIESIGEPWVPLQVASYEPLLFTFSASVAVNQATYAVDQVLAQVWRALAAAFAFEQLELGQSVAASQIIEVIQQIAGVTAVQLRVLGPSGESAAARPPALLCASGPQPPQGAQLLVLDPATAGSIEVWS